MTNVKIQVFQTPSGEKTVHVVLLLLLNKLKVNVDEKGILNLSLPTRMTFMRYK